MKPAGTEIAGLAMPAGGDRQYAFADMVVIDHRLDAILGLCRIGAGHCHRHQHTLRAGKFDLMDTEPHPHLEPIETDRIGRLSHPGVRAWKTSRRPLA